MDGFPVVHRESVRFRDVDSRQHVNNAVFSTFIEGARLKWYRVMGSDEREPMTYAVDMVLARTEIDFRSPIVFGEAVEVGIRSGRIGSKSVTFEFEIRANGRLAAEAKCVLVGYDYERMESAPIPEHWRERLTAEERRRSE